MAALAGEAKAKTNAKGARNAKVRQGCGGLYAVLRQEPHLSRDETAAKMGHPGSGWEQQVPFGNDNKKGKDKDLGAMRLP